jgi:phosphoglycerate dehydrogenase-like enzyme
VAPGVSWEASVGQGCVARMSGDGQTVARRPVTPMSPIGVLVPDGDGLAAGLRALEGHPHLRPLRYRLDRTPTPEQRDCAVMVVGMTAVDPAVEFMRHLPHLRLVQTLNVGYDQWIGRLPPGVALSNARGAHSRAVAEWVVAVLLAHHRELVAFAQAQSGRRWEYRVTGSLEGRRVAVLGAGAIGVALRSMLEPLGCRVSLVGRTTRAGVLSMRDLGAVLSEQDAVAVVLPLTQETRGIVDAGFLASMKDGAVLVNGGRGPLVDTDALLREARAGRIRALLDVTEPEPLPPDHPLWTAPGVTITPHVAGSTEGLWERAWSIAVAQVDAFARGETPANLVISG